MEKLLDSFGNEKRLPASINDSGSQAYPFVMSDGLTIYFASTGHQSYGGYDIYVTRYNLANDSYLTPNQLNMPFNSTFNDYLMVIDEEKGVGWFTTDRYQSTDSVCVYTFIPNERISLIENEDIDYMANRAMISSIANTWKDGANYNSLRKLAQQKAEIPTTQTEDFIFVISSPLTTIFPSFTSSSPPLTCNKVDFPEPEGPNTTTNSPFFTSKLISFKAEVSISPERYFLHTF